MIVDPNLQVLLVEDSALTSRMIVGMLETIGYKRIDIANDGFSALDLMRSKRYGLIVSDWDMPRVSGYQLLLVARNDDRHANVTFLMAAANSSRESRDKAMRAKASGYLEKPFDLLQLSDAIATALKSCATRTRAVV